MTTPMRFALKHAVAAAVVTAAITAFSAAASIVASVVSVWVVLLPITALTEWVCVARQTRLAWQIPISTVAMGSWLLILSAAVAAMRGALIDASATFAGILFLVLLIPLGLYWWTMQSTDWIARKTASWWKGRRRAELQSTSN